MDNDTVTFTAVEPSSWAIAAGDKTHYRRTHG